MDTEELSWEKLFPYNPYPQQISFMDDLEAIISTKGIIIAEACNGFGKTVSTLSAILPLNKKIIYVTRTHDQVKQVIKEVESINNHAGTQYSVVHLASREHLCPNPNFIREHLTALEWAEACKMEGEDCHWKHNFEEIKLDLPPILTLEVLRQYGKTNLCPYFLARYAAKYSTVSVCPYLYVFDPNIQKLTLTIDDKILVVDEGHNIDKISQEIATDTISERSILEAISELKELGYGRDVTKPLEDILSYILSKKEGSELASQTYREISNIIQSFQDFYKKYRSYAEEIYDKQETLNKELKNSGNREKPLRSYLNGVLEFLHLLFASDKDKYISIYEPKKLKYCCLDASIVVKPVIERVYGTVIMSGTMTPLDFYTKALDITAFTKSYTSIHLNEKIKMVINKSVTSSFKKRSIEMTNSLGYLIDKVIKQSSKGILLFFPSKNYMKECINQWKELHLITENENEYWNNFKFFIEGKNEQSNSVIVEDYKKSAIDSGAIMACVFRSRNSEGINFPDDECRRIILIGLPLANIQDPLVKAQIDYYNKPKFGCRFGDFWYVSDAFRTSNQALGRGVRHNTDWCEYLLLDARYSSHLKLISEWAKGKNGPEIYK